MRRIERQEERKGGGHGFKRIERQEERKKGREKDMN